MHTAFEWGAEMKPQFLAILAFCRSRRCADGTGSEAVGFAREPRWELTRWDWEWHCAGDTFPAMKRRASWNCSVSV